ncbi:MAG: hypothetical protein WCC92_15905 [Candidatus Korobacteraceae bacterium]
MTQVIANTATLPYSWQMQVQKSDNRFAHRHAANGAVESICLKCFLTVCRCKTEEEAERQEAEHVCKNNPDPAPFLFL